MTDLVGRVVANDVDVGIGVKASAEADICVVVACQQVVRGRVWGCAMAAHLAVFDYVEAVLG